MAVDPKQYCSKTVMKSKENAANHNQEEEQIDTKEDHQLDGNSERNFCPQIDRRLIPSKLFYFLYFSSLGALVPYLALYFKQMKLTPSQALCGVYFYSALGGLSGPFQNRQGSSFAIPFRYCIVTVLAVFSCTS